MRSLNPIIKQGLTPIATHCNDVKSVVVLSKDCRLLASYSYDNTKYTQLNNQLTILINYQAINALIIMIKH